MKKQTIGRIFSLLMCATLAFTSVDLGVFAATDSENTEIVTEVSDENAEVDVTEETDTVIVSDEDTVVTTTEDSDDIVIVDDNITDNNESDDDIVVKDDDVSIVAIPDNGKGPTHSAKTTNWSLNTTENDKVACGYKKETKTVDGKNKNFYILTKVRNSYNGTHSFGTDSIIKSSAENNISTHYRDIYIDKDWYALQDDVFSADENTQMNSGRYEQIDSAKKMASKFRYLMRSFNSVDNSELEIIGARAFYQNEGLQFVNLRTSSILTTIGTKAFYGSGLKSIILPDNITSIAGDAIPASTKIYCTENTTTYKTLLRANYSNIYVADVIEFNIATKEGAEPTVVSNGSAISRKTFSYSQSVKSTNTLPNKATLTAAPSSAIIPQATVKFTASPTTGYSVESLIVNGVNCTSSLSYGPVQSNVNAVLTVKPNTYTLTLNANGGTCSQSTYAATYDATMSGLPTPTRKGYIFVNWNTAIDGSGTQYSTNSTYTKAESITLYAQWKSDEKEYTVDLDSVGGSCDVTSIKIITTQPYPTLPTPIKSGYSFMGWFTEKEGKGTQIKQGDRVVDIFDTLYAYYTDGSEPTPTPSPDDPTPTPGPDEPNPTPSPEPTPGPVVEGYNIKYVYPANASIKKALPTNYENQTIKLPKATMKGYIFVGWFVNDVKVTTISKYVSVCRGNITVEARFAVKDGVNKFVTPSSGPCSITYDFNGGVSKVNMPTSYANRKTVKIPTPVREGYKFLGWYYTNPKNELVKVSKLGYKMGVCEGGKNIKLKAMWTPKQYKIKLNGGGGKKLGKTPTIITFYNVDTYLPNANNFFKKGDLTAISWTVNGNDYKFDKPYRNLGKASGTVKVTAKWLLTIKGSNYDVSKLNEVSENSLD